MSLVKQDSVNYQRHFWSFWNILVRCGSFWIILGSLWMVVGRCGWLWVVLGHFGSFWVVPRFSTYTSKKQFRQFDRGVFQ